MYKIQTALKCGALSIFATAIVSLFGLSRAYAASYTYGLTNTVGLTGFITTSCDNCVLNASNITAWSMTVPGYLSVASTVPGAQVSVPAGDTDMVATPGGLNFNFSGPFGGIGFSDPSGSVSYADAQGGNIGFGPGNGVIAACTSTPGDCMFVGGGGGPNLVASVPVPFVGSVSYTFTGNVTSATGIYAGAGATVSGTFTFDLNAGDGALPASLTTSWSSTSTGTSRLVASTLTSGSVTFSDAGSTSNKTTVAGLVATGASAPNEYFASDTEFSGATKSVQHSFQIVSGTGANAPFNSNGLPTFQSATGTGTLLATTGNATVGQLTYTLTSLTAAPTTLSVSPASLTFPSTLLNTQSAPLTVSLKNTSPNDVSLSGVGFTPDANGSELDFQVTADSCPEVLSPNASCSVSIIFAPIQATGLIQNALNVTDDAQGSPQLVSLAGTATALPAPAVTLTTQSVNFAGQRVGTTSAAQAVTLKNTGNAPLAIFSIRVGGGQYQADAFTLLNHCVPTLAPGSACTVFVSFTPLTAGQATANLVISDNLENDGGGVGQSISLFGNGTTVPVPGLALSATSLNFATQVTGTASVKQAFNLTNTGTAPLKISSIALAGPQAGNFMLQNACVSTLPAGQHCAVFVTFKPAAAGQLEASVVVTSNAGGVVSVPLFGTATPATAPVLTLSVTGISFGSQKDGTVSAMKAVNLTNSGTAPLSLSSISLIAIDGSQAYFALRNDCVPVLAPGRLCTLFISFNPMTVKRSVFATLVINDNAQVSQQTVLLSGEGF